MAKPKKIGSCLTCKHINRKPDDSGSINVHICKAFPKGIPLAISMGGVNHDKPYNGDNGIQYEPNEFVEES